MQPDAVLVIGFGGPEGPDEVLPFLRRVTRGRGIPDERLVEVGEHYAHFGGVSPINAFHRDLVDRLAVLIDRRWPGVGVYWGNRNTEPFVADALAEAVAAGAERPLALVTSAYSSYSGCRQYREDLAEAVCAIPGAPAVPKVRPYFDHPGLTDLWEQSIRLALADLPGNPHDPTLVLCSTHSIPVAAARAAGPGGTDAYVRQHQALMEVLRQRLQASPADGAASPEWDLCFQSRSGPPQVPWLEPDVSDRLRAAAASGIRRVVLVPLGFLSDHIEVLWDLDTVAAEDAAEVGLELVRARTPGHLAGFAEVLVDVLGEYLDQTAPAGTSSAGPTPAVCAADCCLPVARPGRPAGQD